jgi:hypothetical protein
VQEGRRDHVPYLTSRSAARLAARRDPTRHQASSARYACRNSIGERFCLRQCLHTASCRPEQAVAGGATAERLPITAAIADLVPRRHNFVASVSICRCTVSSASTSPPSSAPAVATINTCLNVNAPPPYPRTRPSCLRLLSKSMSYQSFM